MKQTLLRKIPSINDLLVHPTVAAWLAEHPRQLVTDCLRQAVDDLRKQILEDSGGHCGSMHVSAEYVLSQAGALLHDRSRPHLRGAINATGVILHTGLGRAVWPECVVDSIIDDLRGYVTLAIDRETGERSERDERVEYILTELTGAEAATVVNNNAAATMLVLAALAAEKEVVVSRGQLIEIGGAFRLPDVMSLSRAKMVEVGTTNRTHLKDYAAAITENTAALLRVHPSNFRVVGFTAEVDIADMAQLGHSRNVLVIDDLGAGALVGLERYGLPHEPTVQESLAAGADVAMFSADKLIGSAQAGVIVGKKSLIAKIRKHPLARACRPDKTQVMVLERTLALFRDPAKLTEKHPLYRMLSAALPVLQERAEKLQAAIVQAVGASLAAEVVPSESYLGSGSLPMEAMKSFAVKVVSPDIKASELARRLRMDDAAVFGRIESNAILLDARTLTDAQVPLVAAAVGRSIQKREAVVPTVFG